MYLLLRNYFICTAKFLLFYNGGRIYQLGSFLFVLQKSLHFWMLEKYATWIYFICTAKVLTFLDSEGICYKLQQTLQLVTNIQTATNIYKLCTRKPWDAPGLKLYNCSERLGRSNFVPRMWFNV